MAELLKEAEKRAPRGHPHDEEHRIQCACVRWFRFQHPSLAQCLFAVPNGGRRDRVTGAKLKAEGVIPGVADLLLLVQRGPFGGLCIEMKTHKGYQSPEQKQWQKIVEGQGYRYAVCRSLDDFIRIITDYLNS